LRWKTGPPVDQHPDLPPRLVQAHRHGQDLGFVVGLIHQWHGGTIEERAELCRTDMDIDLVGADVDAFHQTCKQGALATAANSCRFPRPAR